MDFGEVFDFFFFFLNICIYIFYVFLGLRELGMKSSRLGVGSLSSASASASLCHHLQQLLDDWSFVLQNDGKCNHHYLQYLFAFHQSDLIFSIQSWLVLKALTGLVCQT